jgi:hypothetical protein
MFEDRVFRETFGPKMDEIIGEWRILHNELVYMAVLLLIHISNGVS